MESQQIYLVNIAQLCRICLTDGEVETDVKSYENGPELIDTYSILINFKVRSIKMIFISNLSSFYKIFLKQGDGNANVQFNFCNPCLQKLRVCTEFKTLCRKSNEMFMEFISPSEEEFCNVTFYFFIYFYLFLMLDVPFTNFICSFIYHQKITHEEKHNILDEFHENPLKTTIEPNNVKETENDFDVSLLKNFEEVTLDKNSDCNSIENEDKKVVVSVDDSMFILKKQELSLNEKENSASRLVQYPSEEVNRVIEDSKKSFCSNTKCIKCGFESTNVRSLAVHVGHVHK